MKRTLISILVIGILLLSACGAPTTVPPAEALPNSPPAEQPTAPTLMPTSTNSETDAKIAELEAKIRELEAENQRLLAENRELSSENQRIVTENQRLSADLEKVTTQLQTVRSLVTSSSYTNTLSKLSEVWGDSSDLAGWVGSLPDLPPLPPMITVSQINDAIEKARALRELLRDLPDLPPSGWPFFIPFPEELLALDEMRQTFITMTEWMEELQDLPDFLAKAGGMKDLRLRIETYLSEVPGIISSAGDTMQAVREALE